MRGWFAARRVKRGREIVAANRCVTRPGLTHDWDSFDYVCDTTTLAPAAETGRRCRKCGTEEL